VRLLRHQLAGEQRIFWRNREGAFFVFLFPIVFLLLLGSVYDGTIDGYRASDLLLVGLLGYGAANTAFAGLAILLVIRRESGLLKRIRATPLPAPAYLTAAVLSMLVVFVLQTIVMFALGVSVFDADGPEDIASLVAVMLLGSAAFAGMGLGTAAMIRSADGASAVVNLILLPMAFISGSFVPTQEYPEWLQAVGDVLPLKHLIDLLRGVYLDGDSIVDAPGSIAVLAAWGVLGALVAARRFGWEPRER
jgi:ABC-2 type transport system permease protein